MDILDSCGSISEDFVNIFNLIPLLSDIPSAVFTSLILLIVTALVPFPLKKYPDVRVVLPVPPLDTGIVGNLEVDNVPDVISVALWV